MAQINEKQIQLAARGDLIVGDANADGDIVSIGNQNQVLQSNGTDPVWAWQSDLRSGTGELILEGQGVSSSVNYLRITNADATNDPVLEATGADTNLNIRLVPSGTGTVKVPNSYTVTDNYDLTTKIYVDSVATGLDVKNSSRVATTGPLGAGFTYNNATQIWSAPNGGFVIDGVNVVNGDRILVKDEGDPGGRNRGHGIWVYDDSTDELVRAPDADNSPNNEVSGGLFTFVEEGTQNADSGWVLSSPDGEATLGTDDLDFTQFSEAGVTEPGQGLSKTGTTLHVNVDSVTTYIDGSNNVAVVSSGTANEVLLSDGANGTPSWGQLPLNDTNAVTGVLQEAQGGTGESSFNEGDILLGDSGGGLEILPLVTGSGGRILFVSESGTIQWADLDTVNTDAFVDVVADIGGSASADSTFDALTLTGGNGVVTTATPASDTITFDVDADEATVTSTGGTGDQIAVFNGLSDQVLLGQGAGTDAVWGYQDDLRDSNGNFIIDGQGVVGASNWFEVTNSISGDQITIKSQGVDTNVDMLLEPKGTGQITVKNGYTVVDDFSVATKFFVDDAIDALLLKETVKAASTQPLNNVDGAFVYVDTDPDFWQAPSGGFTLDGIAITDGDRVLIKSEGNPGNRNRGHGIWVYDDSIDRLVRSKDADNTPNNELGGGVFLFVEQGTVNQDTGWLLTEPNGVVDIAVDDVTFIQITENGVTQAGVGLEKAGVTLNLNIDTLGLQSSVEGSDLMAVYDVSAGLNVKTPIANVLAGQDVGVVTTVEQTASGAANETLTNFFSPFLPFSDDVITVFFNGLALSDNGWSRSGADLTLNDSANGYSTENGDVIAARYERQPA